VFSLPRWHDTKFSYLKDSKQVSWQNCHRQISFTYSHVVSSYLLDQQSIRQAPIAQSTNLPSHPAAIDDGTSFRWQLAAVAVKLCCNLMHTVRS
jgi:hypothetical protein